MLGQGETTLEACAGLHAWLADDLRQTIARTQRLAGTGPRAAAPRTLLRQMRELGTRWGAGEVPLQDTVAAYMPLRQQAEREVLGQTRMELWGARAARVLLYAPPAEQHVFGLQLLSEQLTKAGFEVELMLRAQPEKLFAGLTKMRYDALGITVGCDENMAGLSKVIAAARETSAAPGLRVVLGGGALDLPGTEYAFLGADHVHRAGDDASLTFATGAPAPRPAGRVGHA